MHLRAHVARDRPSRRASPDSPPPGWPTAARAPPCSNRNRPSPRRAATRRIAGDVDDRRAGLQLAPQRLEHPQLGDHVVPVYSFQLLERVVEQSRLRARSEDAGVVDDRVQAAQRPCRLRQRPPVCRVGDVARHRHDTGNARQLRTRRLFERRSVRRSVRLVTTRASMASHQPCPARARASASPSPRDAPVINGRVKVIAVP